MSRAISPRENVVPAARKSIDQWASAVNRLVGKSARAGATSAPSRRSLPLLFAAASVAGANSGASLGYRMARDVAERLAADGLDPDFLADLAAESGIEAKDLLDFVGLDRTTVSRRKASGAVLPTEAAVKSLQLTELLTQAAEVFGSAQDAGVWLTRSHPLLDGETPLRRARTPWGLEKVQSVLVALRYGGAA